MNERLRCPSHPAEVPMDMPRFREEVEHDRCPLSGCALVPWPRVTGIDAAGQPVEETTGRCDPEGGGCGGEWAPHGAAEVAWYGREIVFLEDWDDEPAPEVADS